MRNIAFAIWMVGFCFCCNMSSYFEILRNRPYTDANLVADIMQCAIWVFVGALLYEREPRQEVEIEENKEK